MVNRRTTEMKPIMRMKSFNVTEDQIVKFLSKKGDFYPPMDPFKVIEDLKNGKQWTYKGIPIILKPRNEAI